MAITTIRNDFLYETFNSIKESFGQQNKRFVPFGIYQNSAFGGTSFTPRTLGENLCHTNIKENH